MTKVRPARWAGVALACGLAAACSSKPVEMRAQLSTATTNGWPSPTTVPRPTTTDAPANAPASKPGYIPSASTLVLTADNDALSEGWAHIEVTTSGQGHYADYSEDSGPAIGHQMITIDGAHAEAIVIGGVAYARGDGAAVVNRFGLPAADEWRLANQWILFSGDDAAFSDVSSGVTLRSELGELTLGGTLQVGAPTVIDGVQAVPITGAVTSANGNAPGTGTLYITPGSHTLPVEMDVRAVDGTTSRVRYSQWGVAVALSAPAGAVPASSVASN